MEVTPYADSGVAINATLYNQAGNWLGHSPYGWGRYFNAPDDNGKTTSTGITWYSSAENAFFNSKQLRLLPIAGQGIPTSGTISQGQTDAQNNLQAVLKALGGNATTPFFAANGVHYCAFALDCETPGQKQPKVFTDYLYGWLKEMGTGITDTSGNRLKGWTGVYGAQDYNNVWNSVVDCVNQYGIRPNFIVVSSYIDSPGTTPPPSYPATWNTQYTTTDVPIGQSTTMWQYAGDAVVTSSSGQTYDVDVDMGNPDLDFHTALGQYAPIPN